MIKIFLTLLFFSLLSSHSQAEVEIMTIDGFKISNMGAHGLIVSKRAENSKDIFSFMMHRPYCICENPSFVVGNPEAEKRPAEDSYTAGSMRIDFKKAKEIEYLVYLARPEAEHNVIIPKGAFPSVRQAKVLEIDTVYGKSKFIMAGFKDAMKQATKICESYIPYVEEKVEAKEMDT
jgi:hypothetical protein